MKIESLTAYAERLDARHGADASAYAVLAVGLDADEALQRRAVWCEIMRRRRADRRLEYHERAAGMLRGDSVRDSHEAELSAVEIDPLRYLDCLDGQIRDIVRAVISGEKQSEIAIRLGLSQQTISNRFRDGIEIIRRKHGIG